MNGDFLLLLLRLACFYLLSPIGFAIVVRSVVPIPPSSFSLVLLPASTCGSSSFLTTPARFPPFFSLSHPLACCAYPSRHVVDLLLSPLSLFAAPNSVSPQVPSPLQLGLHRAAAADAALAAEADVLRRNHVQLVHGRQKHHQVGWVCADVEVGVGGETSVRCECTSRLTDCQTGGAPYLLHTYPTQHTHARTHRRRRGRAGRQSAC